MVIKTERFFRYFGELTLFVYDTFYFLFSKKRSLKSIIREITSVGVESLFLVSLISFFVGIIIAFQTAYQLKRLSSEIYIAPLVVLSLTRELGPVLSCLIIAARSGASITARIGSMKISEQIDALETFSIDPVDYLVVPKFVALVISCPALVVYADLLGVFGGYLVGALKFSLPFSLYLKLTLEALTYKDIVSGLIKSLFFASIIAFVSCFEGFRPQSSVEVAKAVTSSVVRSFILIIVCDCILTAIFYFIFV